MWVTIAKRCGVSLLAGIIATFVAFELDILWMFLLGAAAFTNVVVQIVRIARDPNQEASAPVKKAQFAEFGIRMVGVGLDFSVAIGLAKLAVTSILAHVYLTELEQTVTAGVVLLFYFTGFWASPLRATPAQLLLGMRVVDEQGQRLGVGRSLVRSMLLVGLIFSAFSIFEVQSNPYFIIITVPGFVLIFLAALTPGRQAAHDFAAGSIVVNRGANLTPERRRPTFPSILGNLLVLGVPIFLIVTAIQIGTQRDMRYRTNYAISAVAGMKLAVEEYYRHNSRWPTTETELGVSAKEHYPDGGYYELESDGVIRIRFTVRPELVGGSIVLRPSMNDEDFEWQCSTNGFIEPVYLPAMCRD